jgi:hypothetical protein
VQQERQALLVMELLVILVIEAILDQPVMMEQSVTTFSTVEIPQRVM